VVGLRVPHADAAPQPGLTSIGRSVEISVVGGQFHWKPDEYHALMRAKVPDHDWLQDELVAAAAVTLSH
jgi:hypothetical protein